MVVSLVAVVYFEKRSERDATKPQQQSYRFISVRKTFIIHNAKRFQSLGGRGGGPLEKAALKPLFPSFHT